MFIEKYQGGVPQSRRDYMLSCRILHTIPSGFGTIFTYVFYKHKFPSGMARKFSGSFLKTAQVYFDQIPIRNLQSYQHS